MDFLNKLLNKYNLSLDEYKIMSRPLDEVNLPDPNSLLGMDKAVVRIKDAMKKGEKIVIYGDYDCDGIMATSIMVKCFKKLNYDVGYYIPSRYLDGYGLNKQKIDEFFKKNYSLIITVDNGVTLVDEVKYAKEKGIDVIVTDHHEYGETLPDAISIIHPIISKLGNVVASGGAMAYYLSVALLGESDEYLLTLAMTSLISDLMQLKDYNRDMTRLGLKALNKNKYVQYTLLNDDFNFDEKSISMKIAPKINAIGRVIEDTRVNHLVKFFVSEDVLEIRKLFNEIEVTNNYRKELTNETVESLKDFAANDSAIVISLDIKEGLVGLIASKMMNDFNKPCVVFTSDSKDGDILKGSVRSKNGFNVTKAFESLKSYLLTGGGHAAAGGLSIKKCDFDNFKRDFIKLAEEHAFVEEDSEDIEISLSDVTKENYNIVKSLSPYGVGLPEPVFEIKNVKSLSLTFMSMGKHISTSIGFKSRLLGFNMSQDEVSLYNFIDIHGTLRQSEFKGNVTTEFLINKYNKSIY